MISEEEKVFEEIYRVQSTLVLGQNPPEIFDDGFFSLLAMYLWTRARINEALACFNFIERQRNLLPEELNIRGYWQLYKGESKQALQTFEGALDQLPDEVSLLLGKAFALFYLENYNEALKIFQNLINQSTKFSSPYKMAAACKAFVEGRKPEEIQLAPLPGLPTKISQTYQLLILKSLPEVIYQAKIWLNTIPTAEQFPLQRLLIELKINNSEEAEALELINPLLKIYREDGLLWRYKGVVLSRLNQPEKSHEAFGQAVRFAPFDSNAWAGFAAGFLVQKKFEKAIKNFRIAIFLEENISHFWSDLGQVYGSIENYSEARKAFTKAIHLGEQSFQNYLNRGICSVYLGESNSAVKDLEIAIALQPDNSRIKEIQEIISKLGIKIDDRFKFGNY